MTLSNNIDIAGYNEFIFDPTETTCGGTGFYIKNNLDFYKRNDLQLNSPSNYESTFVEIIFPNRKNLIIGCIYRHPSSKISTNDFSSEHLEPILQKISKEKKECVLMGDFNIDMLKSNGASEFYTNLSSHFFTPFILQPTRLKAKTLIDNIFFNSLEFQSNSGNVLLKFRIILFNF